METSVTLTLIIYGQLGHKTDYVLKGEIIKLDSTISNYKSTSYHYSVQVKEYSTMKEYKFEISQNEYQNLKKDTFFEKHLTIGSFGFIYLKE
jgi:hypothetical protein